jgi:hypothetical protein
MQLTRIILILFLLKSLPAFSQDYQPDSLYQRFREDVETEQRENAGRMLLDDDTKESYYLLIHHSSISDLLRYINDPNVHIRLAIFNGLLQKETKKEVLEKILADHQTDTISFEAIGADVSINWRTIDYMQAGMHAWSSKQLRKIDYEKELKHLKAASMHKPDLVGLRHGIMEKEQLLKTEQLMLRDSTIKIVSFILNAGDDKIQSVNNRLTPEMKELIKKTAPGELVIFDTIKFFREDQRISQIPSVVIRLN